MGDVSIRELRNDGGSVVERVLAGELVTVTRGGNPVAQLRPVTPAPLSAATVLERWRNLPHLDLAAVRADVEQLLDVDL